ncbi:MAG: hypothetical protein Crog4KO_06980 [Crocinitomicaceae bacterium]
MKLLLLSLLILCATNSNAQIISAELVTIEDINVDGVTPIGFDDPTMNSNGTVAVVGISTISLNDFVFVHDSIFFQATDWTSPVLEPISNQCGIDDFGNVMFMGDDEFNEELIYKSDIGQVIREEDLAPGFVAPAVINFIYRPMMLPNGWIYFIASIDEDDNGSTDSRAMYQVSPTGVISLLYSTNNLLDGQVMSGVNGYDLDFDVSENQVYSINVVDLNTGSTLDDGAVSINGSIIVQENSPIDLTENYDNFDMVRINSSGDYLITGDSDGDASSDEIIIVNGDIHVREGDILDGYELTSAATCQGIDINDNGDVAFTWATSGIQEYLFSGNVNAPGGLADSKMILKRNDSLDIDGDFEWDYYITDFNAFTGFRGFELKDTNILYMNVDLVDTAGFSREAIIKIDPFCRPLRNTTSITSCHNDTLMIGNSTVTSSGTYYDTLSAQGTCMSIERYHIDYLPEPAMGSENAVICAGDSILLAGNYYSLPGTYTSVLPSSLTGCDSTVEVQIANLPVYDTQLTYQLCQGDSLLAGGAYQTTDGVYVDSLTSVFFCDSIVTRTVSFVTEYNTPLSYNICQGDSILLGGSYQTAAGTYNDTLFAQFGCDSILVQTLNINTLPSVTLASYAVDSICYDAAPISLPIGTPTGGIYSGNGVSGSEFDPNLTGLLGQSVLTYTYSDTNGCISTAQTSIVVYDCYLGLDELINHLVIYPNPSQDVFHVELSQTVESDYRVINELGQVIIEGEVIGSELDINLKNYNAGHYYLEIGNERFKMIKID